VSAHPVQAAGNLKDGKTTSAHFFDDYSTIPREKIQADRPERRVRLGLSDILPALAHALCQEASDGCKTGSEVFNNRSLGRKLKKRKASYRIGKAE
jgi:hypothetical protein